MLRRNAHVRITALLLALCAGGMGAQALPQRCGPLKEVASLEMTALGDGARESVTLAINGAPVRLLVDTGAGMSSLTGPAATQLGIRPRDSATMHLVNQDGITIRRYYVADSFQLGPLTARNVPFMQDAALDDARVEGAIGPDLMARYDVEMDFAGQRLTYFSQDHCPGHILHWSSDVVTGVPISVTPRARDYPPAMFPTAIGDFPPEMVQGMMAQGVPVLGADIRVKVLLNGQEFIANIDTSLDVSTINSRAAEDVDGVPLDRPRAREAHDDQPAQADSQTETVTVTGLRPQHRFRELAFGGVEVLNPLFVLKPGPGIHKAGDPTPPDITIGMNVLRRLHLYFAFGEKVLYVSAADPPR